MCSAATLASAVPVNTGHGDASPQPVSPLSVRNSKTTECTPVTSPLPCECTALAGILIRCTRIRSILWSLISADDPEANVSNRVVRTARHVQRLHFLFRAPKEFATLSREGSKAT